MNLSSLPTAAIAVRNGTVYTEKLTDVPTVSESKSPYERAVKFVETFTGKPRSLWENRLGHPFDRAATTLAKRLAGVPESRSVKGAPVRPTTHPEN